jgi:cytochrome P450
MILLPSFTPAAVERLVPRTREICRELIARFLETGRCDAAVDYAQHIPVRVISLMLGLPESDGDRFRRWVNEIVEAGATDAQVFAAAIEDMQAYFRVEIAKRRQSPGDDLISALMAQRIDGRPLSDEHLLGTVRLLLIAGIDTTWSAIGASLWHLATHAEDRRRLGADPALMPTAIEEFLRAYAPVTMARKIVQSREVGGTALEAGQMTLLCFPSANRDPAVFPDADKVLIDRKENRHAAFGLGIHRCVGSNLARMEMRVALEEWLDAIADFELAPGARVEWSGGAARGPRRVPVVFSKR